MNCGSRKKQLRLAILLATTPLVALADSSLLGCYEVDSPAYETGRNLVQLRFFAADGGYGMTVLNEPGSRLDAIRLHSATLKELDQIAEATQVRADAALVLTLPADAPNAPALPILTLLRQRDREPHYLFYGPWVAGDARPMPCP